MDSSDNVDVALERAAELIANSDGLLIAAGAGMGVDSGLPDFRGDEGLWNAYPPFRGRKFAHVSNPIWFRSDPVQAWGFFGHRLNLYRETTPHLGFSMLRKWAEERPLGYFVFTSNVDGHFQQAGFDSNSVLECHGSIHYLQCSEVCTKDVWSADGVSVSVDEASFRATSALPACSRCEAVARPNILMFGDYDWHAQRCREQEQRYEQWLRSVGDKRLAIIEFGAGKSVPTVRYECESQAGALIRVNPRDYDVPNGAISIPLGALNAIEKIDALL